MDKFFLKEAWGFQVSDTSDKIVTQNNFEGTIVEGGSPEFGNFPIVCHAYHKLIGEHKAKQATECRIPTVGNAPDKFFVEHKVCGKVYLQWCPLNGFGQQGRLEL